MIVTIMKYFSVCLYVFKSGVCGGGVGGKEELVVGGVSVGEGVSGTGGEYECVYMCVCSCVGGVHEYMCVYKYVCVCSWGT